MAQDVHQQPGRVAARAAAQRQGLFAGLHIGFHADEIADVAAQLLVQSDQEIVGRFGAAVDLRQVGRELGARRLCGQIGR